MLIYAVVVQGCPKGEGTKFKVNRNGVWPVILKSINGVQLPEKSDIMDGSIAESLGIVVGSTYTLMISRREDYVKDGKSYLNYDYAPVGGNVSQQIGTQIAAYAIGDIAKLIAKPVEPKSDSDPNPQQVLNQPLIINADKTETETETDEELEAELKRVQAAIKSRKAAAKKAAEAEAAPADDVPF